MTATSVAPALELLRHLLPLLVDRLEVTDGTAEYNALHDRRSVSYDLAKVAVNRLTVSQERTRPWTAPPSLRSADARRLRAATARRPTGSPGLSAHSPWRSARAWHS